MEAEEKFVYNLRLKSKFLKGIYSSVCYSTRHVVGAERFARNMFRKR